MKIIVCIKQVPNTNKVEIDPKTGTLNRQGVTSIINPDDLHAIEEALRIKEKKENVEVTVLTMGPPQADTALREALALGVDEAIHLTDRNFAGSDTWATATILAAAIRKIGDYDIIFCGREAIDGDTAQVGPELAEFLDIPQVTYVKEVDFEGEEIKVKRAFETGTFVVKSKMPVLLTVIEELNEPRFMDMRLIYEAYSDQANFKVWDAEYIEVDQSQIGIKNSPTRVYRSFVPKVEFDGQQISGAPKEVANKAIEEFKKLNII